LKKENEVGLVFEYPNEFYNKRNLNERFKDRFAQIAADGMYNATIVNFFYTGTGIVLYCNLRKHEGEEGYEEERIKYYLYFNKK